MQTRELMRDFGPIGIRLMLMMMIFKVCRAAAVSMTRRNKGNGAAISAIINGMLAAHAGAVNKSIFITRIPAPRRTTVFIITGSTRTSQTYRRQLLNALISI